MNVTRLGFEPTNQRLRGRYYVNMLTERHVDKKLSLFLQLDTDINQQRKHVEKLKEDKVI